MKTLNYSAQGRKYSAGLEELKITLLYLPCTSFLVTYFRASQHHFDALWVLKGLFQVFSLRFLSAINPFPPNFLLLKFNYPVNNTLRALVFLL